MRQSSTFVMREHAAWRPTAAGTQRVLALPDGSRWLALAAGGRLKLSAVTAGATRPQADRFALPGGALDVVPELAAALRTLGVVTRLRNPDLWDAIATAIIRQVIRAAQSKKLYRAFCDAYGDPVELPGGTTVALLPTPQITLSLTDQQFAAIGLAFKRRPLRAAAEAYLEYGAKWCELPPAVLVQELQTVPRIGAWTAGAAVADFSNDWALYPYADLAVRTWAKRAAPSYNWPSDEPAFGQMWRALARDKLSAITVLTLAWGSQHGDIG
jgi:DNA-3-methyladenine glycosylase II